MTTSPTPPRPAEPHNTEVADANKGAETTPDRRLKFTPSEGILIAIASATAYLWTFQYERGFASYFGIPSQFINVSLINVLFVGALLTGVVFLAIPVVNALVVIFLPRVSRHPLLLHHATTICLILPIALFPAYVYGTLLAWIAGFGMVVFLVIYIFVLPLLSNRQEVGYMRKLEAQAVKDKRFGATTIFGLASRGLGPNLTTALWFFILSFYFASVAGDAAATNQKDFLVTTDGSSREMVLLRVYSENLILAPFDRNTKEVQRSFTILKGTELKTPLTLEEIGPLKPVPVKAPPQPSPVPSPSQNRTIEPHAPPSGSPSS